MNCPKCGIELQVGEWPWCPHGLPQGMLGKFQERVLNLDGTPRNFTSLSELRKAERAAGLEQIQPHEMDRIGSVQQQARRSLEERQRASEPLRHRIIGEALRAARERRN